MMASGYMSNYIQWVTLMSEESSMLLLKCLLREVCGELFASGGPAVKESSGLGGRQWSTKESASKTSL